MLLTLDTLTLAHTPESPYGVLGGYVDSAGVEWVLTSEKGWWGGPASRTKRTDRLTADGQYRAIAYRGARIVALGGTLTAPTDLLMRQAQQKVLSVCADGSKLYPLTVQDETGTFTANVELDAEILAQPSNAYQATFSLQLAAPDPRKYTAAWLNPATTYGTPGSGGIATAAGIPTSAGMSTGTPGIPGTLSASNPGTAPVGPVLRIDGPVTNPVVSDVVFSSSVAFAGSIDAGHSLWINCDDQPQLPPGLSSALPGHAVLLDGAYSRRAALAIFGGWPQLVAGGFGQYLFSGTSAGSPLLTCLYRPAWR